MNPIKRRPMARLLLVLIMILLFLQAVGVYRGWRIVLVGLAGVVVIGILWVRALRKGLHLEQQIQSGWVQVGDRVLARLALENKSRLPALWVEVVDRSTLPTTLENRVVTVGGRNHRRWLKEAVCTRRGLFTLGPMALRTGDPFGLYSVQLDYPDVVPFLVMPQVVSLPSIEVAAGGRASEGRVRNEAPEETVISTSAREYQPGDELRWVHWPTTARRDSLYVRRFDGAPSGDWWIVVDADLDVHVGVGDDSTLEHAIILAASMADRGLRAGRSVGLVAADDDLVWRPAEAGETQRWQVMRSLALLSYGNHPLSELLGMLRPNAARSSIVVVTPSLDSEWIESLVPLIRRGDVPTVLLLDPESFDGAGDSTTATSLLAGLGVLYYRIDRELLLVPQHQVEGAPKT